MISKIIEIRDAATFIPALAVQLGSDEDVERRLTWAAGFGSTYFQQSEYIVLCKINGGEPMEAHSDPIAWGQNPRTMFVAHMYLANRHGELGSGRPKHGGFELLAPGAIIDVEWILGLRDTIKETDLGRMYA